MPWQRILRRIYRRKNKKMPTKKMMTLGQAESKVIMTLICSWSKKCYKLSKWGRSLEEWLSKRKRNRKSVKKKIQRRCPKRKKKRLKKGINSLKSKALRFGILFSRMFKKITISSSRVRARLFQKAPKSICVMAVCQIVTLLRDTVSV